ncbi:MAG: S8 family serine peptidase [Lachnospiraceae bacterium]|jgi:subtilisin family serine protease|nr:S8 family serine peptidase [Lachnospiraceae bacterium]
MLLVAVFVVGLCSAVKVRAEEKKQYVVVLKNGRETTKKAAYQKKAAQVQTIAEQETDSQVMTLSLTKSEAEQMRQDANVAAISEDLEVTAFFEQPGPDEEPDGTKKTEHQGKTSDSEENLVWNMKMIHADDVQTGSTAKKVKVAVLDSGVDETDDIPVAKRKNFVPGEEEVFCSFDDPVGHGTAIAGIISSAGTESGYQGVNPNVEIYSGKIFEFALTAPISRVVEAIHWAIEEDVDVINLSFGLQTDSEVLRYAIQEASEAGIIIVAAAGNKGVVEYPANYPEVIAVGSVDSMAEIAEKSATGENLELLAPGELVASISHFGGIGVESGTSLAAPHVTGAVSVLLQKNPLASVDLIRYILQKSANRQVEEGYGLLDIEQAVAVMDAMMAVGYGSMNSDVNLAENKKTIEVFENDLVEGSWDGDTHIKFVENNEQKDNPGKDVKDANVNLYNALKAGARANDEYVKKMTVYPEFHGWAYYEDDTRCNYVASYFYFIDLAQDIYDDGAINNGKPTYLEQRAYNTFKAQIRNDGIGTTTWATIFKNKGLGNVTEARQCAFLYGMALHVATDTFAHSAYVKVNGEYVRIVHGEDSSTGADSVKECENRYECAKEISKKVIRHYYTTDSSIPNKSDAEPSDFVLSKYDQKSFKLRNLTTYLKAMGTKAVNVYNANSSYFDALNYTKPKPTN